MECKDVQPLIERYFDSELPLSDQRQIEDHLGQCRDCARLLDGLTVLRSAIKTHATYRAPATLTRALRTRLKTLTGEDKLWPRLLPWFSIGGGAAAFASVLTWVILSLVWNPGGGLMLSDEIIGAHVRSLMVDHATDIASSDRHTVKPWFNGKLDFSPPVVDTADAGYPLVGGRLEYLQQRTAAALVYRRRDHVINVFFRPARAGEAIAPSAESRQGYQVLGWAEGGLQTWVVSDLNPEELQAFANILRGPERAPR